FQLGILPGAGPESFLMMTEMLLAGKRSSLAAITRPQRIDGMGHPHVRPLRAQISRNLEQAADVASEDCRRAGVEDILRLPLPEPLRHLRLGQVVAAGRAAADFGLVQ